MCFDFVLTPPSKTGMKKVEEEKLSFEGSSEISGLLKVYCLLAVLSPLSSALKKNDTNAALAVPK